MVKFAPLKAAKNVPVLSPHTTFYQSKTILFLFYHLVTSKNSTLLLNVMLQALILHVFIFFTCLALLISIIPSHMSNMINSLGIKIVKVIIINIIKFYNIKVYIIANECNNIRVYITKDYIIIRKYIIIKFFNNLTCNKPIRN